MDRNLVDIIDKIIIIVPDSIEYYEQFCKLLEKVKERSYYSSPETIGWYWQQMGLICQTYLQKYSEEEWDFEVRKTIDPKIKNLKRKCSICNLNSHIKSNKRFHPN